jgi:hypothetical protein
MHSFAELRANLGGIAARSVGPSALRTLRNELWKLGELREKVSQPKKWIEPSPKPLPVTIIDHTDFVAVTVKERPVEVSYARPRTYSTSAPASISYNAERYLPYRILWAKVIIRATYDYALWRDSPDSRLRKFAQEAEKWLFEPSDLELSFENICFAFDFPIEKIRKKTRLLTRHDVKKLEFMDRHGRSDSTATQATGDTSGGNHR